MMMMMMKMMVMMIMRRNPAPRMGTTQRGLIKMKGLNLKKRKIARRVIAKLKIIHHNHILLHYPQSLPSAPFGVPKMQALCNEGITINSSTSDQHGRIYLKLITTNMFKLPKFDTQFKKYHFEWMTKVPGQFSTVLVCMF